MAAIGMLSTVVYCQMNDKLQIFKHSTHTKYKIKQDILEKCQTSSKSLRLRGSR